MKPHQYVKSFTFKPHPCNLGPGLVPRRRSMELVLGALPSLIPKLGELLADEYKLQKGAKREINVPPR